MKHRLPHGILLQDHLPGRRGPGPGPMEWASGWGVQGAGFRVAAEEFLLHRVTKADQKLGNPCPHDFAHAACGSLFEDLSAFPSPNQGCCSGFGSARLPAAALDLGMRVSDVFYFHAGIHATKIKACSTTRQECSCLSHFPKSPPIMALTASVVPQQNHAKTQACATHFSKGCSMQKWPTGTCRPVLTSMQTPKPLNPKP